MKNWKVIMLIFVISLMGISLFSQKECKVLLPEISKDYSGKCKKGLANGQGKATGADIYEGEFRKGLPHGKGTYTWSTGEVFTGKWKKGKRNGEGKFTFQVDGRDSITLGIWKNDVYIGKKKQKPYVINRKIGVDRYSIKRQSDGNRILIDLKRSGVANTDVEDLMLFGDSGDKIEVGRSIGFENVEFPFSCKINFKTKNKLHSNPNNLGGSHGKILNSTIQRNQQHDVVLEFVIKQAGNWQVTIHN